jgi:metal-responsive CopG/Arc/MetJ family transcriptional regulator
VSERKTKAKLGRPIEYRGGLSRLTATVPKELLDEFERRWRDLGSDNLSRGVVDALRCWVSSRSMLGTASTAVLVELPLEVRKALSQVAASKGHTLGTLMAEIATAYAKHLMEGRVFDLKTAR